MHWLGEAFHPGLRGYFPGASFTRVMGLDPEKLRGCKLSLLEAEREVAIRRSLLPREQIVLTGDVLSAEAVARMQVDRIATWGGTTTWGNGYGLGWSIDRDTGRRSHGGGFGSRVAIYSELAYGVVLFLEADSGVGGDLQHHFGVATEDVLDEIMNTR